MDPRRKASLLWGIVGGLAFLALVQGYELVGDPSLSPTIKVGVAAAVTAVTALVVHRTRRRLRENESA